MARKRKPRRQARTHALAVTKGGTGIIPTGVPPPERGYRRVEWFKGEKRFQGGRLSIDEMCRPRRKAAKVRLGTSVDAAVRDRLKGLAASTGLSQGEILERLIGRTVPLHLMPITARIAARLDHVDEVHVVRSAP